MDEQLIIRRRPISAEDLTLIRSLIEQEGARGRTYISKCLCEIWDWRQSNGRFREIACRDLLRRLQAKGLIELPAMLGPARRPGYRNKVGDLDFVPLVKDNILALVNKPKYKDPSNLIIVVDEAHNLVKILTDHRTDLRLRSAVFSWFAKCKKLLLLSGTPFTPVSATEILAKHNTKNSPG